MIKLKVRDNDSVIVNAYGDTSAFNQCLAIIKDMPVREYDRDTREWSIPISDIVILKKKCQKRKAKVEFNYEVKECFQNHIIWRKGQAEIKEKKSFEGWDILKMKMFPFQTVGAEFLYNTDAGLLLDHVGLGKTFQALAVSEKRFLNGFINFGIIICPSTLKKNWAGEIEKFTDREYFIITGDKAKRKKQYKNAYKFDYLIINYDLLHWDIDLIDELILQRGYEFTLIGDEIQFIKNNRAKRSQIFKQISAHSKYRIGLSATVIENNILDLWSVFHMVSPHIYGGQRSHYQFMDKFVITDWFGNPTGYKNPKLIKSKMKPYVIRRFKEDVLDDLPDRVETNVWIELSPPQRKLYNEVSNNIITSLDDMEKAGRIEMADILPMFIYLRQCVLSTHLVGSNTIHSTKLTELLTFLESMDGNHKIVVFCFFVDMVELLYDRLEQAGYKVMGMHGENSKRLGTKLDDRVPKIDEFNQSKEYQILVTSDILSTGVNITSASYLINFDLLYNPAKMEQRAGRIDRIGQKNKKINIINIIALNTIDEKIYNDILMPKSDMSKDLIDDNKTELRITSKSIRDILAV